jgi:hypothetical protein
VESQWLVPPLHVRTIKEQHIASLTPSGAT